MVLPNNRTSPWRSSSRAPTRIAGSGSQEYDLYEKDGEFVLSVEMPGFEREEIDVAWNDGRLTIAATHDADRREKRRSFRRSFRLPKEIEPDEIRARYQNGVLDVYLPTDQTTADGKRIPVEAE